MTKPHIPQIDNLPNLSLEGKKILVTGVSRSLGIGASIVNKLALSGAKVAYHGSVKYDANLNYPDASEDFYYTFAEKLTNEGLFVTALDTGDFLSPEEPAKVIRNSLQKLGGLDGIVLNHAFSTHAPIKIWDSLHIDNHLIVNVRASMLLIKEFSDIQNNNNDGGAVTLFTSGQQLGPMTGEMAYAVSKEAICGLCKQSAVLLAPKNIRVNCINPGPTDTGYLSGDEYDAVAKMFPSGRWGTPEDAARLVHFLQSDYASWITGQIISSEGGFNRFL